VEVRRRRRRKRLCACGARSAQQAGPSTSPLDVRAAMVWLFPGSLASGFVYIVLIAVAVGWIVVTRLRLSRRALWLCAALVPPFISYVLYWGPFWVGPDSDQAGLWAPVCIVPWSAAGIVAFAITLLLTKQRPGDVVGRTSNNRWRGP
jgi:hypothetical protein